MQDIEDKSMIEFAVVISESESSLIRKFCYENQSEKKSSYGDL